LTETAAVVRAHYRTVQQWVAWYRAGGLAGVGTPRIGGRSGPARRPQPEHEAALVAQANTVGFATVAEAATWLEAQTGTHYSPWGMRWVPVRLGLRPKVTRPLAAKASLEQQAAWKGEPRAGAE
jgi:transposase